MEKEAKISEFAARAHVIYYALTQTLDDLPNGVLEATALLAALGALTEVTLAAFPECARVELKQFMLRRLEAGSGVRPDDTLSCAFGFSTRH